MTFNLILIELVFDTMLKFIKMQKYLLVATVIFAVFAAPLCFAFSLNADSGQRISIFDVSKTLPMTEEENVIHSYDLVQNLAPVLAANRFLSASSAYELIEDFYPIHDWYSAPEHRPPSAV